MNNEHRALRPTEKSPATEEQKRWLSWNIWAGSGRKHTYQGTVTPEVKAKRRKAGKVAKASRKANRK